MASVRATIMMRALRAMPGFTPGHDAASRMRSLERSRRYARLMTVPQPRHTRTISAAVPGVKAQWHVGHTPRTDARIVYLHGGAYNTGSPTTHRHFTAALAKETGIPVLSVDYRLAPEHPFPAALEDAVAAYRWAQHHGPDGPHTVDKLVLAGDSAGGGLCIATAMKLRDDGALIDGALIPISPWMDLSCSSGANRRIGHLDVMLNVEHAKQMAANYVREADVRNPYISPLYGDFADLPPMFMTVGGRELVLDEAMDGAEKAREAGVNVTLERQEEMFHIWPVFYHLIPEGRRTLDHMVLWLRDRIPGASTPPISRAAQRVRSRKG